MRLPLAGVSLFGHQCSTYPHVHTCRYSLNRDWLFFVFVLLAMLSRCKTLDQKVGRCGAFGFATGLHWMQEAFCVVRCASLSLLQSAAMYTSRADAS